MRLKTRGAWTLGVTLALAWVLLTYASVRAGLDDKYAFSFGDVARGLAGSVGWGEGLGAPAQAIVELRLWRALTGGAVGASLALAGALLQGLFRNGLASPSVVGVTAGSVLGASVAIALIGGYGSGLVALRSNLITPALVTACALAGAVLVTWIVVSLATTGRRLSVPTLLLAGIAMNTLVGGVLAALQSFTLQDFEVSRAILAWTFGTLDDRSGWQVGLVWGALVCSAAVVPFVALELDLFAGGEEDAEALGVPVQRIKALVIFAVTLATSAAVSVAGQIPFVGLVVPHVVRSISGASHRALLPLSMLLGAVFLLGCDVAQRTWFADVGIRPGVLMSLVGGPFFLFLLVKNRRLVSSW